MRRRTALIAGLFALSTPGWALAQRRVLMRHPAFSAPPWTGEPGVAPMVMVRTMPAVEVTIDGQGPFTLGIDTGADGYVHLSETLARTLGLPVVGEGFTSDPTGKNPVSIRKYRTNVLTFAGVTFHDVRAEGMPQPPAQTQLFDGLLGMDLFDDLTLKLDFKARQVGLSILPTPPADGASIFSYPPGPTIRLPLTIGHATFEADLDTGNMGAALVFPSAWIGRLPTHGPPRERGIAHTVSQAVQMYSVSLDATAHVGGIILPASEVDYPNVAPVANIGSKALAEMIVRIDRPNRRVQLVT
jgi:hypothetical protein